MNIGRTLLTLAILGLLVAVSVGAAAAQNEPVYKMEGAWHGIVTVGMMLTPSLDTFTSDAQRQGVEGTFLCTIPAVGKMPNPANPSGWLAVSPSGHGNWVRIAKNRYAFTALRSLFDEIGKPVGWAKYWGTITPISDNEYTGTMTVQYYLLNGTAMFPQPFTGTMHSNRIEITLEQ